MHDSSLKLYHTKKGIVGIYTLPTIAGDIKIYASFPLFKSIKGENKMALTTQEKHDFNVKTRYAEEQHNFDVSGQKQINCPGDICISVDFGETTDNKLAAYAQVYKNGMKLKSFTLEIPLKKIQTKVLQYLANSTGWGWSDIKKSAKRITRKVGVKHLMNQLRSIANDPRFKKGLAIASTIYPPLGLTYSQIQNTANLLDKAKKGSTEAIDNIKKIKGLAESGDIKAATVSRALITMNEGLKRGVDVSGWAWNLPYRSPLVASSYDIDTKSIWQSNPLHLARAFYSEGAVLGLK